MSTEPQDEPKKETQQEPPPPYVPRPIIDDEENPYIRIAPDGTRYLGEAY